MNKPLDVLRDKDRIVETIHRLFIGTDNRDGAMVRRCFAPSVLFDLSSLGAGEPTQLTPQQTVSAWDTNLKPLKAIHHQAGNYLLTVDGAQADAFCYRIAIHYLPHKSNANTRTFVGSYDFGLHKGHGEWTISKFKCNLK